MVRKKDDRERRGTYLEKGRRGGREMREGGQD